jgi:hypothetical protein
MQITSIAVMIFGGWLTINGILHDVFILRSPHGKIYDRNLLRLLMDGHILITSGIVLLFCARGIQMNQPWAYYIALTVSVSILAYCLMIFPFLKSIGTLALSIILTSMLLWQVLMCG